MKKSYRRDYFHTSAWQRNSPKFACGLLDKVAWVRGGLITFNTNLSRFSARSHTSLLLILVIRAQLYGLNRIRRGAQCSRRYRVNQDEQTWERLAHHFTLRSHLQRGGVHEISGHRAYALSGRWT